VVENIGFQVEASADLNFQQHVLSATTQDTKTFILN
jgi:hypothetical protein